MKRDTCWRLFSFLIIDHKAAQEELNRMAAQGWALKRVCFFFPLAQYQRTGRTDLRYFVDWTDAAKPEEEEYLRLCEDAGWELAATWNYLNIYASRPGSSPQPIHTDPELEYQRYRKKVLRRMAIGTALCLATPLFFLLLHLSERIRYPFRLPPSAAQTVQHCLLTSNGLTAFLLTLPFLVIGCLLYLLCLFRQLHRWRRISFGEESLSSGLPAARVRGWLTLLGSSYLSLVLLLLMADSLLNGFGNIGLPIGMAIGCGIRLALYGSNPRERQRLKPILGLAVGLLLCFALHGPVRSAFPGRFPTGGVFSQAADVSEGSRTDAFLGSQTWWSEVLHAGADGSVNRLTLISFTAHTWSSPFLADWDRMGNEEPRVPVEGYESVWQVEASSPSRRAYLLRRGSTWLTMEFSDNSEFDPLPAAVAWLEKIFPV